MEAILVDCVQKSLRHFMHANAIFLCHRLCAEFPTETNLQLLAGCYLQNNQAYSAYHILKGAQMAQSRYLFAISCFQMDLLSEAETALCPASEPSVEVPNGAAGHYLLGLIYRYTDRRKSAIHHFKQALSMDPLMWAAYEELCILGAAEDATAVFGEAAALCVQKQYLHCSTTPKLQSSAEDCNLVDTRHSVSEDTSPRQLKLMPGLKDVPGNHHGASILGGTSQPINSGLSNISFYNTPSPMATQISGRLFSDSGPRRSSRLSSDASLNANAAVVSGNGTGNSSKYLGGSKLSSMAFRSMAVRKGQSWANENADEGTRNDVLDDSRLNVTSSTSSSTPTMDAKSYEQEAANFPIGGQTVSGSKVISGASEILTLLRIFGEGCRLAYSYSCQDALDTYMKLPLKHYNTGWVLSQVILVTQLASSGLP